MVAEAAHDKKLQKYLKMCTEEGIHFVPLAWELEARLRRCMRRFASGLSWRVLEVATLRI